MSCLSQMILPEVGASRGRSESSDTLLAIHPEETDLVDADKLAAFMLSLVVSLWSCFVRGTKILSSKRRLPKAV